MDVKGIGRDTRTFDRELIRKMWISKCRAMLQELGYSDTPPARFA